MNIKEKLEYLCQQDSHLTQQEASEINRLYRKIHARRQAQTEPIEVLSDALFVYNDLMSKKIDLLKLQDLFSEYIKEKGFKQSLLKVEEISILISNDIKNNNHILDETNNLIRGMKGLISQTESKGERDKKHE